MATRVLAYRSMPAGGFNASASRWKKHSRDRVFEKLGIVKPQIVPSGCVAQHAVTIRCSGQATNGSASLKRAKWSVIIRSFANNLARELARPSPVSV